MYTDGSVTNGSVEIHAPAKKKILKGRERSLTERAEAETKKKKE